MATERTGTIVHWDIDAKGAGIGYFQRWSLPVPGDYVTIDDADGQYERTVKIIRRVMEQPERDQPFIRIVADTVHELGRR